MPEPRGVLSIQSDVVRGHVGNAAARCALQRVGVEVWATGVSWGESFRRVATGLPLNQLVPIDELSLASLVVVWVTSVLTMGAARVGLAHMYRERLARAESA